VCKELTVQIPGPELARSRLSGIPATNRRHDFQRAHHVIETREPGNWSDLERHATRTGSGANLAAGDIDVRSMQIDARRSQF